MHDIVLHAFLLTNTISGDVNYWRIIEIAEYLKAVAWKIQKSTIAAIEHPLQSQNKHDSRVCKLPTVCKRQTSLGKSTYYSAWLRFPVSCSLGICFYNHSCLSKKYNISNKSVSAKSRCPQSLTDWLAGCNLHMRRFQLDCVFWASSICREHKQENFLCILIDVCPSTMKE